MAGGGNPMNLIAVPKKYFLSHIWGTGRGGRLNSACLAVAPCTVREIVNLHDAAETLEQIVISG